MPAGSGPQVVRVTTGAPAVGEIAIATLPPMNWQAGLAGVLLAVSVNLLPGTGQTLVTLRIRQGAGTGGNLVGIAHADTTVAAQIVDLAFEDMDTSAFATSAQQGAQYTLTMATNAVGPGTVNQAVLTAETTAPIQ